MDITIATALLLIWVVSVGMLVSGYFAKPGWILCGVAVAHLLYGGYQVFAGIQGGTEI